jgi:zinc transport system substrate-binding protein
MRSNKICLLLVFVLIFILSCQQAKESGQEDKKLNVMATIFPVYDFARNIGGDKINVKMLLPPGTDAHHYELKPEDIVKVTKADIFLFTNFELEQWAFKIIKAADKNTNMLAIETGSGTDLLPLNQEETAKEKNENHEENISRFDPHIWLDMDNAQKMVDNIADTFIKKDSRNSDYYKKNAGDYKLKLAALDQRYRAELSGCKTKTILHAGHSAFAYLAKRYNLQYIAVYNVFADAEPSPQQVFTLIEQIKNEKVPFVYYEDMINPRLAQTIAQETDAGLLKLNNGHDISKKDLDKGVSFISIMENNLTNLKKGMKCPQK